MVEVVQRETAAVET